MHATGCLTVFLLAAASLAAQPAPRKVLVLSVDGLDHRYLRDADQLGLKIPTIRRLMKQGQWASSGVLGVVPTVTWPSHTTMISGVPPHIHGILGNRRPKEEGGDYYWNVELLKSRTLLDACRTRGKTSAAITWPVTVNAPVDWNLPEYFQKRRGGAMDLPSIASKSTPGLVDGIARMFPSFAQEWMDDRTRALATRYLLKTHRPDLLLVHFVDLDSEAHDNGPFSREANAILEYTDELIATILADLPPGYVFVLVSDHGFERVDREVPLASIPGARAMGGIAVAPTPEAAAAIRALPGTGRQIPPAELERFAPTLAGQTVFEPAPHHWFVAAAPAQSHEPERGRHGHWPSRYRATWLAHGPGLTALDPGELLMTGHAARIANILGIPFEPGLK